jgi:hypothetical protein
MALWRDRLAGQQLLLVLDDAASSEQVRPLLPGAGGSLVLVTSRRHLSALEDATAVSLDTLPPGEAAGLLVRLASRAGLSPDDPAAAEIARLCGYLPLAIGMVARQLHHHPAWTAAGRAAELAAARDRLELMTTENLSVAAAFDLSYADLGPDQQRLFRGWAAPRHRHRRLRRRRPGRHRPGGRPPRPGGAVRPVPAHRAGPGPVPDARPDPRARPRPGRPPGPGDDRDRATARLLDYYQHTAARADALIARQTRPAPPPPRGRPRYRPRFPTWPTASRPWPGPGPSAPACSPAWTTPPGAGQHARVIALTAGLAGLLRSDGPWADAITRHTAAIQAARHLGDRLGQANALTDLGDVRRLTGDYPAAAQALEQALGIYRDLGDRLGQANALHDLGDVRRPTGDYPAAAQALEQALGIYRDLGDRLGQANALSPGGRPAADG